MINTEKPYEGELRITVTTKHKKEIEELGEYFKKYGHMVLDAAGVSDYHIVGVDKIKEFGCEYCNDVKPIVSDWEEDETWVAVNVNNLCLISKASTHSETINFCPMCGRDLRMAMIPF